MFWIIFHTVCTVFCIGGLLSRYEADDATQEAIARLILIAGLIISVCRLTYLGMR